MLHRVIINLAFTELSHAQALYNHAHGQLQNAISINCGKPTEEISYIQLQECFHDESPTNPCIIIKHAEVPC